MADAGTAAKEFALSLRPQGSKEEELREQDNKYNRIAPQAVQRVRFSVESTAVHAKRTED